MWVRVLGRAYDFCSCLLWCLSMCLGVCLVGVVLFALGLGCCVVLGGLLGFDDDLVGCLRWL